ncbi:MAG: PDZ domain-containing protein, partial [Planctomycetota bacterium]
AAVRAGGPAATMGLQAGDRLVNVAGRRIRSIDDLRDALSGMKAGESIRIVYRRDGARAVASGTLGTPPADDDQSSVPAPASPRPADGAGARPSLGVVAELVDGVVVLTGFSGGSPPAAAGARVGDAIARIAGSPVEGFETIIAALEAAAPGDRLPLTLLRDGRPIDLRVQLGVLPVVEEEPVVEIGEETSALSPLESTRRPYVGVEVEELGDGVWVVAVHGDSPARAAGLRGGDRILAIGSRDVIDLPSMRDAVLSLPHDAATGFTILREGRTTDLEVTPTPR